MVTSIYYINMCILFVCVSVSVSVISEIQWNLNNPATYGPGFIGCNNEVARIQCKLNKSGLHTNGIKWPYYKVRNYKYAIISTNGMNVDDEVELSRILARIVPDSLTKVLGVFDFHHTRCMRKLNFALKGDWRRSLNSETKFRPERGLEEESPLRLSHGYGCGCKHCFV